MVKTIPYRGSLKKRGTPVGNGLDRSETVYVQTVPIRKIQPPGMVKTIPYRGDLGRNLPIVSLRTGAHTGVAISHAAFIVRATAKRNDFRARKPSNLKLI